MIQPSAFGDSIAVNPPNWRVACNTATFCSMDVGVSCDLFVSDVSVPHLALVPCFVLPLHMVKSLLPILSRLRSAQMKPGRLQLTGAGFMARIISLERWFLG